MSSTLRTCLVLGVVVLGLGVGTGGCSVGWHYQFRGQNETMTSSDAEYYQAAIDTLRAQFGDLSDSLDTEKLHGACQLIRGQIESAPKQGHFTSARQLLERDANEVCARSRARAAEAQRQDEQARYEKERESRERGRRVAEQDARDRRNREQATALLERSKHTLGICEQTAQLRSIRKRHAEILDNKPGALIKKTCTARTGTEIIKTTCKDTNGFVRPCTKTVSTGEVTGYSCPASIDAEVVALGLYELRLSDGYPFPEDRSVRVRDEDCESAQSSAESARKTIDDLSQKGPNL